MSSNHFDLTFEKKKLKANKMLRLSAQSENLRFPIPALIIAEAVVVHYSLKIQSHNFNLKLNEIF